MARLLKMALKAFGKPKYVITDRGGEFTAKVFSEAAGRLGIVQRFASTENVFRQRSPRTLQENAQRPPRAFHSCHP